MIASLQTQMKPRPSLSVTPLLKGILQRKPAPLRVNEPDDVHEREADRMADAIVNGSPRPAWSLSNISVAPVQREEAAKLKGKEEKYKGAAKKLGEAFLETAPGKEIAQNAEALGEAFIETLPGKIITGAAITGAVAALAATHQELPVGIPEIPLDKIRPGLKLKLTYEGPVDNPTKVMASFSFKFGASESRDKKAAPTGSEKFRAETARIAKEQQQFREGLKTPQERATEERMTAAWLHSRMGPGLLPGLPSLKVPEFKLSGEQPKTEAPEKKEEEDAGIQRKATGEVSAAAPPLMHDVLQSSGKPLDPATRGFMETRLDFDLSRVRIHTDSRAAESARAMSALAYTHGTHVVFAAGQFAPGVSAGRRLLAHELAHVMQQEGPVRAPRILPAIQRKCACGSAQGSTGKCDKCEKKRALSLQPKLTVNKPGDAYEQEADRVADQIMAAPADPSISGAPMRIHRFTEQATEGTDTAPASVARVLASPGRPLEPALRQDMEQRFGRDFSRVRVHCGADAEQSARDVNAHAYTVGHNIVFGAGRLAPGAYEGRRLIAHELTHVVQQSGSDSISVGNNNRKRGQFPVNPGSSISIGQYSNETARHALEGTHVGSVRPNMQTLRRQAIDVELAPTTPEDRKELERLGIDLPRVSEGVWRIIGGVADNAKKSLIEPEKKNIETILNNAKIPTGTPLASPLGGRFLLHDTSASVGAAAIQAQQMKGRGPLGSGVSAYVPAQGDATITRPDFFEARRPSTTEFEKNVESFAQPADAKLSSSAKINVWKKRRDDLFRQVWNATQPTKRDASFDKALAGSNLTATEIQEERTGNNKKKSDPDFNPGVEAVLKAGSTEKATTSTSWTVEEICKLVSSATVGAIAVAGKEKELTDACVALSGYFTERDLRVSSTVPVEIVQPGVKKGAKNQNTCDPANPDIVPLSNPPYSADQYKDIALLYLRACRIAGMFPEITTHFAVDGFVEGHCDPRCFNLEQLYDTIAVPMGHGKGSTYGIKPSYGRVWKTHNVWWHDDICHGKHP